MSIIVEPAEGISAWSFEDTAVTERTVLDEPSGPLTAAVESAVAAGVLVLLDGELDFASVEPDDVSLQKLAMADEARAPLFADRDREFHAVSGRVAAEMRPAFLDASPAEREAVSAATRDMVAEEQAAVLAEWDERMAVAAQAAVEEMI